MTDEAQAAVDVAVEFECKKDACRQQQSGEWTLTLKIHPQDVNQELMLAVPGQRYKCFLVALGDDEMPLKPEHVPTTNGAVEAKPKRHWDDMQESQQAGILCADEAFQRWLVDWHYPGIPDDERVYNEHEAKHAIYEICHVSSRRELDGGGRGNTEWEDLVAKYRADTQQTAEER